MDHIAPTRPLSLNGQPLDTPSADLQTLLLERGYDLQSAFACAVNGRFVPRAQWPLHPLSEGDRVDVIAPVTGG
jgi:sulfur carrier protein